MEPRRRCGVTREVCTRSKYGQVDPAALSSCAQCSLSSRCQYLHLANASSFYILFSSARARSRSSFVLIALIWSIVYGGGPGGAMAAILSL
jgi:hypothetical protein